MPCNSAIEKLEDKIKSIMSENGGLLDSLENLCENDLEEVEKLKNDVRKIAEKNVRLQIHLRTIKVH